MVKKKLRKMLALLMCCAMLLSNLSFAGLAEDAPVAPVEPAAVELPAEEPAPEPAPEAVEPDTTEPETIEPEVTEPEAAEPEATETEELESGGGSEPEVTEPEVIAPEPGDEEGVEPAEEAEPALDEAELPPADIAAEEDEEPCTEHVWNEAGTECEKCGASSGDCSHPSAGWEDNPYWRVSDPNDPEHAPKQIDGLQHEAYGGAVRYKYCGDCGLLWRFEVTDPQGLRWITENHSYNNNESGQRACWVCGYVNTCNHEGTDVVRDEWFDGEYESISDEEHSFTGTRYRVYDCTACGDSWDEQVEDSFTEWHDLNEDGIHCSKCDYVFEGCNHPEDRQQTFEYYEADIEQYPDGSHVISSDENGCKVHARWVSIYECGVCGMRWNHQVLEPDAIRDDEHEWGQDENGNLSCNFCGRENECQHDNAEKTGDGFSRYDDDFDDDGEHVDENGHAVLGDYWENFHCDTCGADYQIREENYLQEGGHEWDDEKRGSICRLCGYENPCQHPNPEPREYYDANYGVYSPEDIVVSFNADGHELHTVTFRDMWCPICDANWDGEIADSDSTHWYEHEWNDDGTACVVCGYESECDHVGTTEYNEWEEPDWDMIDSQRVVRSDETGCEVYARRCGENYCTNCNMHWGWHIIRDNYTRNDDHEWDYDNGAHTCIWCGAENPCDHSDVEVKNEGYNRDTDSYEVLSPDAEHCDVMCHYWADMHCNICQVDFHIDDFEYHYDGEHIWNREDGASCELCDYPNSCEHENATLETWEERDYDNYTDEDVVIYSNEDGHSVHFIECQEWRCPDCGGCWGREVVNTFIKEGEHEWDGDNEGRTCWVCDYENPCNHEDAECVNDGFDPYGDGDIDEDEGESADDDGHVVLGDHWYDYHCDTCGADYQIREENVLEEGEHEWGEGNRCWICGYENPCDHEGTTEYHEWEEPDNDREDRVVYANATSCEVYVRYCGENYCTKCDTHWDWHIINDGYTRIGDHEWDYDNGARNCIWCDAENPCDHHDVEAYNEGYETDTENYRVLNPDAEHCDVICHYWADVHCNLCGEDFHTDDFEYHYDGEHIWNGEDGTTCRLCGWENGCQHENAEHNTWLERNDEYPDGGVISADENGHEVYVQLVEEDYCPDCDTHFGWHTVEIGSADDIADFMGDVDYSYDPETGILSGGHVWNEGEESRWCGLCGYDNPCQHDNLEILDEGFDPYDDGFNEEEGEVRDEYGHTVLGEFWWNNRCLDCGVEFQRRSDPEYAHEEHRWDDATGSICWVCGWENPCKHPEGRVQTNDWWELTEGEPVGSKDGHTGMFQHVRESWCEQCDAHWGWEIIEEATRKTLPHEWNYDEGGAVCDVCGYKNTCKHPKAEQNWEDYDYEGATVSKKTATTHTVKNACKVEEFYCPDCDATYQVRTKLATYTGEHQWDGENECKTCWICGYANPCKHPTEKLAFETWHDPDMSRGGVIDFNEKTHTWYVMVVGEFHCYACDSRWGWTEIGTEEAPMTEPHEWNEEGICNVCGYENSCAHENVVIWNDWYSDYSVVKSDGFSGHSGTANHYQEKYCPDCDFGWIECIEENVQASGDHEWDSEDGGKTCWICGYTNLCKHPASMVHTDTWDELDAENYPNEGVVSSSASGCTVHMRTVQESWCEQCDARYGWKVVKTWTRSGEHEWNSEEAGSNCIYCHRENECTHDNEDQIKVLDEWYEDVLDDGDPAKFGHDANEHWYQATVYQIKRCEQCGAEFRVEAGEETLREGHDWQPGEDGKQIVCGLCGEVNTCEHKHLNLNPHSWYESCPEKGGITKSDAKGHTGWVLECQGYYCPDCGATVNATYTQKNVTNQPHDWSYDENGAFCVICGYVNSCTHPNAECYNEWFEVYEGDERNETAEDYHILYGNHCMEMHCPKCNADYIVREENVRNYGMHEWEWDSERNGSFCYLCGMNNVCGHSNCDLQSWIEPDLSRRDEIKTDAKSCTVPLIQISQKYCPDCGAEIERTETPLDEKRTGAHEWGEDGFCRYCGRANTCTSHKSTVKYSYDSYPEKLQIISSSAIGHKVVLVTYNVNVCSVCGADLGETVKSGSSRQLTLPHSFDENGVCGICGWKNACEHPNATRREFTASYGDQIVSSDANGHVVYGQKYSMMHCNICGAYWDYQQIEAGVKIEDKHQWDASTGAVCIDCGYKNSCTHPKASKKTQTEDYTQVVVALTNDATHTIARETDKYTYCSACGAKFGYTPTMQNVTEAHKVEDGVCTVCGYDVPNTLKSLSFAEAGGKVTLGVGEKYTPQLVKDPADATTKINYKSGKPAVFTVDANSGEITAKAAGTAKLTVSAEGAESATLSITVKSKPTSIKLSAKALTLGVDESAALTATLSSGSAGHISWTSSAPGVAAYDEANGKVVANGIGTAIITATVYSGKTASCTVTVLNAPNGDNMELTLSKEALGVNETATATLTYGNAAGAYEITSDNAGIISVTKKGDSYTIKGVKVGKATITARCTYNDAEVSQEIEVFDAPTTLTIINKISPMGVGESKTVDVTLGRSDSKPCAGTVTFSSSDTSVLAVNKTTGELTAKKAGTATITAQSYVSKVKATVKVTVKKAPTSIKLSETTLRLGVGETDKLTATLSSGSAGYVSWFVDNPDVVDFYAGTLTANEPGMATITASVYNSKDAEHPLTAICTVLVGEAATKDNMHLELPKTTLGKGDTMMASFWYEGGAEGSYTFSATGAATINKKGKITGSKAGTATITVTAYNGAKVSQTIEVTKAPTKVNGVPATLTMSPEETTEFVIPTLTPAGAVSELSVTSGNAKVAEVQFHYNEEDQIDGYAIHAIKAGTAKITVKTYNGISATCTVTVKKSPTSIALDKHELEMVFDGANSKYTTAATTLKATLKPKDCGGVVEWRSSNEAVATVNAKGKVTPVGLGRTTITASITNFETGETFEDYCEVRVYAAPKAGTDDEPGNIRLQPVKATIGVKESTKLEIIYIGSSGAVKANSYKVVNASTDGAIVTVDKATGKITGKKAGTANVQVTMYNGVKLTAQITVVPAPGKIEIVEWDGDEPIDLTTKQLTVGDEYWIAYQLTPPEGKDTCEGSVTYTSNKPNIAKVDKDGKVTALKAGTATITAKTQNGKTDTLTIKVVKE